MNQAIAILAAFGVVAGGAFWLGMDIKQGQWDASIVASREAQDKALDAAAKAIAQVSITQQTIIQKVQHEVQTKTVYRDCVVPDDGSRLLNAAIANQEPASGVGVQPTP